MQNTLQHPKYAYVAPFYRQAKDIAWQYLKTFGEGIVSKAYESELRVLLINGASIRLYGADNPDSLRGVYFDGVILDEYGDMQPRLFGEVIAPTLADRKGWCVFIGTPKGPNHFKQLWEDAQKDPTWYTHKLKASTSGILDHDELEMLRTLPGSDESTYRQEFECDFTAAVRGAYYANQLLGLEAAGNMGIFPHDPDRAVHLSFDIGYSDDTSIWFFQTDGSTHRIVDFWTASGYSANEVLDHLRSYPYVYGEFNLPHDAANKSFQTGKSVREQFIENGAPVKMVPQLSIQDGIQAVRATLPNCQFNTASQKVVEGLNALMIYQREWDDRNKRFKEKPKHDWASNPADAFRYFALSVGGANSGKVRKQAAKLNVQQGPKEGLVLDNLYKERDALLGNSHTRRI
jgi:hypothetical protein